MAVLVKAHYRYLRIAPRKTRYVADLVRGMNVQEAEAQLMFLPQRAAKPILKLLRSAIANARNNAKLNPEVLFIKELRVDEGPKLKRYTPRARGSSAKIQKKSSHLTIVIGESPKSAEFSPRFVIKRVSLKDKEKEKRISKAKLSKKTKREKESEVQSDRAASLTSQDARSEKEAKAKVSASKEPGVFKKVFRRKSV